MTILYTKEQIDNLAGVIGYRIKDSISESSIINILNNSSQYHLLSTQEKQEILDLIENGIELSEDLLIAENINSYINALDNGYQENNEGVIPQKTTPINLSLISNINTPGVWDLNISEEDFNTSGEQILMLRIAEAFEQFNALSSLQITFDDVDISGSETAIVLAGKSGSNPIKMVGEITLIINSNYSAGISPVPEDYLEFSVTTETIQSPETSLNIEAYGMTSEWEIYEDDILLCDSSGFIGEGVSISSPYGENYVSVHKTLASNETHTYMFYVVAEECIIGHRDRPGRCSPFSIDFNYFSSLVDTYSFRVKDLVTLNMFAELLPNMTDLSYMFKDSTLFNSDISFWDVKDVVNMDYFLSNCSSFNQDLSGWCVSNIPSEPIEFSLNTNAWTLPKPIWGTCPGVRAGDTSKDFLFQVTPLTEKYKDFPIKLVTISERFTAEWELFKFELDDYYLVGSSHEPNGYLDTEISNVIHLKNEDVPGKESKWCFRLKTGEGQLLRQTKDESATSPTANLVVTQFGTSAQHQSFQIANSTLRVPEYLPPCITTGKYMFSSSAYFNQDISMWDVSNITTMSNMFNGCRDFNQDLSSWCVRPTGREHISFDYLADNWVLPKPVWGTCPRGEDGLS